MIKNSLIIYTCLCFSILSAQDTLSGEYWEIPCATNLLLTLNPDNSCKRENKRTRDLGFDWHSARYGKWITKSDTLIVTMLPEFDTSLYLIRDSGELLINISLSDTVMKINGSTFRQPTLKYYKIRDYYPSGKTKIEKERNFDGRPHGKWKYYSEDGKLIREEEYNEGRQVTDKKATKESFFRKMKKKLCRYC